MDVRSDENKSILYQILSNHPLKNINHDHFIKALENQVFLVHKDRFKFKNNLVEMNKEIIRRFSVIENDIKNNTKNNTKNTTKNSTNNTPISKKQIKNLKLDRPVVTRKDNKNAFASKLKNRQDEISQLVNPQKPKEIDFSDKANEDDIPSIDSTLAEREKELRMAMKSYNSESAAKWIGNKELSKNIKIDNNSKLELKPEVIKKKVTFKEPETRETIKTENLSSDQENNRFLSKLKKKSSQNNSNKTLDIPESVSLDIKKQIQNIILAQKNLTQQIENLLISIDN